MKEIIFVTHNKGKIASAHDRFNNIDFKIFECDLDEPRSDNVAYISEYKVKEAYKLVNKPCISLDAGFWIDELNGFPKAFVNFTLDTIGIKGILKLMDGIDNRTCKFIECLSYYDGSELKQFTSYDEGKLSKEVLGENRLRKWSDLWYIYIPNGYKKTLAQLTDDERSLRKTTMTDSMKLFADWFENH